MRDLQLGGRVTLPNLEQTGLLVVDSPGLVALSDVDGAWSLVHPMPAAAPSGARVEIGKMLLDEIRRRRSRAGFLPFEGCPTLRRTSCCRTSQSFRSTIGPPPFRLTENAILPLGAATRGRV
jgi:hypothetical protein